MPAARLGPSNVLVGLVGLFLSACGGSATTTGHVAPVDSPAAPRRATPDPVTASATAAPSSPGRRTDITRDAAREHRPTDRAPTVSPHRQVDYRDLLAVARGYVAARNTYRYDDAADYRAALTAPALTTPTFAVRSVPNAVALARLRRAQKISTVRVGDAELADEAPNSGSARYVVVTCTTTTTYRGGASTRSAAWTVRLVQVRPDHWRVDGVLSIS